MFRSLTNTLLGNSRIRRVTSLGLAGVVIAATGFGLTQIPAQSEAPQAAATDMTVAPPAEAHLTPIPGPTLGNADSTPAMNPASPSSADASNVATEATPNPYAQAQYTDQVPPVVSFNDAPLPNQPPVATGASNDDTNTAHPSDATSSLPPTSLADPNENGSTTAPPPSLPNTLAEDNNPSSLNDPPQPIPATMPAAASPETPQSTPTALPAAVPPTGSTAPTADTPQPSSGATAEATAAPLPSAYPTDNYPTAPAEVPSTQPNAYAPQNALGQALPPSTHTPQPLPNRELLPVPSTAPSAGTPVPLGTPTTDTISSSYGEAPTTAPSAAISTHAQATASTLQPSTYQSPINGKGPVNSPGARKLEGLQTPSVTIEKSAPSEVQVGQPATFEILVRNVGQATAHNVMVQDVVPAKTRFAGAEPEATTSGTGTYTWQIPQLAPGEEQLIKLHVVPEAEGEIGSIAQVSFQAQASVRTVSTQPRLKITYEGPQRVLIGDDVALRLTISNEGSGAANNVSVAADVPTGLSHPSGTQLELENAIPVLLPDEKRTFELLLESTQAGTVSCPVQVSANGQQPVTKQHQVEIVSPQMQLAMRGPVRRYLERDATLTIQLGNAGTAPATNVELVAKLPQGLEFIEADKKGEYDAQEHAVYWFLDQLPVNQGGSVQLRTLPVETGLQTVVVEAEADLNAQAEVKHQLQVESLAELVFSVSDTADPIEMGTATTYVISVKNSGDKPDSNIRVVASLPPGLEYVSSTGPTKVQGQPPAAGQPLTFTPLASLAAQESVEYRIQVRGISEGDQKLRVSLQSDEVQRTLIAKEESTRVYRDDR